MNLEQKIEAVLFYKNEPQEIKKLAKLLEVEESELRESLKSLSSSLENRGVTLVMTEEEVALATAREIEPMIEKIAKEELSREIGKAGLETLAIILYNGGASRREIDYLRGVNSTFILRNLSIRGLVEKIPDPKDQRTFIYKGSLSLLTHLGINKIEALPEFENFKAKIAVIKSKSENKENEGE